MEKLPILTVHENRLRTLPLKLWSKLGFALILIFVISFAIRVFRLDFYSLWYDEVSTAYLVQPDAGQGVLKTIIDTTGSETMHPLYYLVLGQWTNIAGDSVWALRFPSVLFGSCAVVVYGLLLYRIGGRRGLAFASLLVVSPFLIWYSRDARPYALIMLLSGLHLLFYLGPVNETRGRTYLLGFIITGILSIYSGIFIGMLLAAELIWSAIRRRRREILAVAFVLVCATPLVWHGLGTFFAGPSGGHGPMAKGMSAVQVLAFPQELLVARSFGPTPHEVRQLSFSQVLSQKSLELTVELLAVIGILASFVGVIRFRKASSRTAGWDVRAVSALAFVALVVCVQAGALVGITDFRMNARHIGFIFGPLFVVGVYVIGRSDSRIWRVLFVLSMLVLWAWSSGNQFFNRSYVPDDFKGAAGYIKADDDKASGVVALCLDKALRYYGVTKPIFYLRESPSVTIEVVKERMQDEALPVWLVLNRPWNYPNFRTEDLPGHFRVLDTKQLSGITMWLLSPIN